MPVGDLCCLLLSAANNAFTSENTLREIMLPTFVRRTNPYAC